jgi:hypothetical protein
MCSICIYICIELIYLSLCIYSLTTNELNGGLIRLLLFSCLFSIGLAQFNCIYREGPSTFKFALGPQNPRNDPEIGQYTSSSVWLLKVC